MPEPLWIYLMALRTCTLCGGQALDVELRCWHDDRSVVGVTICHACQRQGNLHARVDALLDPRYAAGRFGPNLM